MNLNFIETVVHLKSTEASFTLIVTFLMQKTYARCVYQALLGTSGSTFHPLALLLWGALLQVFERLRVRGTFRQLGQVLDDA